MNNQHGSTEQYDVFVESIMNANITVFENHYRDRKKGRWFKGLIKLEFLVKLCVLYRKPEFLKLMYEIDRVPLDSQILNGLTVLDLAKAIGAEECVKIIDRSCEKPPDPDETIANSYKLYTACIRMSCNEPSISEINVDCINTLSERGYNINDTGPAGKTPLHEAVSNKADVNIFEALIRNGADVDKTNTFGISPFEQLFKKFIYFERDHFVAIVHQFIRGNPYVNRSNDMIVEALKIDKFYRRAFTGHDALELYGKGDFKYDSCLQLVEEHRVTPILVQHGFLLQRGLLDTIYKNDKNHPDLVAVLQYLLCNPPTLLHLCRNVLRRTFPGRQIVTMCNAESLTKPIRSLILLDYTM